MLTLQRQQFEMALEDFEPDDKPRSLSVVTGLAAAPQIKELVSLAEKRWPGLHCTVYPVVNDFFGHNITVAGLITGRDMIAQLKGKDLGERLLFPDVMLRFHTDVFLDDITQSQIEDELGVPMVPVQADDGYELLRNMIEEPN